MPNKAVAKIVRAKFRDALKKHPEVFKQVPKKVWRTEWVVDIEPVGKGEAALKYLTPYIFGVAISNNRIENFQDGKVTFRYQDNVGNWHRATLEAEKFTPLDNLSHGVNQPLSAACAAEGFCESPLLRLPQTQETTTA